MIGLWRLIPAAGARACAVCFGVSANSLGFFRGIAVGIAVLLAFTFSMIAGLVWVVWRVEKNRALCEKHG